MFSKKDLLYNFKNEILGLTVILIFLDIFVIKLINTLIFITLLLLLIASLKTFGLKRNIIIIKFLALSFLILSPIFFIFNLDIIAEKFAVWAFVFLSLSLIDQLRSS